MDTNWKSSAELFAQIIRRHGAEPDAVTDVSTAWNAFQDFAQVELDGVEPGEDGERCIIQWGCWDWNDHRPALVFTRTLAVNDHEGDRDDEYWQPQYWNVEIELLFADDPAWADLEDMAWRSSEVYYAPVGPERTASLAEAADFAKSLPQIQALWNATPTSSRLIVDRADGHRCQALPVLKNPHPS